MWSNGSDQMCSKQTKCKIFVQIILNKIKVQIKFLLRYVSYDVQRILSIVPFGGDMFGFLGEKTGGKANWKCFFGWHDLRDGTIVRDNM